MVQKLIASLLLVLFLVGCNETGNITPYTAGGDGTTNTNPNTSPVKTSTTAQLSQETLEIRDISIEEIAGLLERSKDIQKLYDIGTYQGEINTIEYSADGINPVKCVTSGIYAKDKSNLEYDSNCYLSFVKTVRESDSILCKLEVKLHYNAEHMSNMGYEQEDFQDLIQKLLTPYIGEVWARSLVESPEVFTEQLVTCIATGKKYEFTSMDNEAWIIKLIEEEVKGEPNYKTVGINLADYLDDEDIQEIRRAAPGVIGNEVGEGFKCKAIHSIAEGLLGNSVITTGETEYDIHQIKIPSLDRTYTEMTFKLNKRIDTEESEARPAEREAEPEQDKDKPEEGKAETKEVKDNPELNLEITYIKDSISEDKFSIFIKGGYNKGDTTIIPTEQAFKDKLLVISESMLGKNKVDTRLVEDEKPGRFYYPEIPVDEQLDNMSYYSYGGYGQGDETEPSVYEFLIGVKEWK